MTQLTRSEVRANREKAVAYLQKPSRRKAKNYLDAGNGNRCCLGHMCFVLDVPRKGHGDFFNYGAAEETGEAPDELIDLIGLWDSHGGRAPSERDSFVPLDRAILQPHYDADTDVRANSLVDANDDLPVSPQRIGRYLESVIEGGPETPWKPLSSYPETI